MNANFQTSGKDHPTREASARAGTICQRRQYEWLRWKLLRETERYLNNPHAQPWERQKHSAA